MGAAQSTDQAPRVYSAPSAPSPSLPMPANPYASPTPTGMPSTPGMPPITQQQTQMTKEIEDKKIIIDQNMVKSLSELGNLMKQYNKNDVPQMLQDMQSQGIKLPKNIIDRLRKTHQSVLDNIDNAYSYDEKTKKIEDDSAVSGYIQKDVDKDLDLQLRNYMENPFIKDDPMVQRGVKDVAESIKSIRGKYKFFEYKYLQMNVFLMAFINHVSDTLVRFVSETSAFYEAKEKYHLMLIRNLVKTFQDQLEIDSTDKTGKLDAASINVTLKELTQSVIDGIEKQKEFTEKSKQQSLQDILKFLMEREGEFADELVGIVEKYKSKKTSAGIPIRSTVESQYSNWKKPYDNERELESIRLRRLEREREERAPRIGSKGFYNPNNQYRYRSAFQRGGFVRDTSFLPPKSFTEPAPTQEGGYNIRDNSFMPQRFYDL